MTLNHTILWNLALRIFKVFIQILLNVNLFLNQILLTFLLYVRQGLSSLIRKNSATYMHGLAVYVKEMRLFAQGLSLENPTDSHLCLPLASLLSVSYFFFLYQSPSSSLCTVFDAISSNIINPSANVFVFGDFNVHHKDWQTYSAGSVRPDKLCYNFLS